LISPMASILRLSEDFVSVEVAYVFEACLY